MTAHAISLRSRTATSEQTESRAVISFLADALVAAVGLLSPFSVKLVGTLPVGEILLVAVLPFLLVARRKRILGNGRNIVYILMALWLFGQVISDIYRSTDQTSWMKGQANIVFFVIDFLCITVLTKNNDLRKTIFFLSFAIGSILECRYQPTDLISEYPWKFGYSVPITILLLLFGCIFYRFKAYFVVVIPIAIGAVLNLVYNYRSAVLFLLVTLVLTVPMIPERVGRLRILPLPGTLARSVVLAGLAVGAGLMAMMAIRTVSSLGIAGEDAQRKNLAQIDSRQGLLLGARPEILVSSRAVLDSPILGHGSWAKDPKYIEMLYDIDIRNGIQMDLEDVEQESLGLIPTHSHLMGAWVNAGVLGAVFWAYIFWLTLKATIVVSSNRYPLAPLYVWMLSSLLWAIWFSPFGNTVRITEAMAITIILDVLNQTPISMRPKLKKSKQWRRSIPASRPIVAAR